MQSADIGMGVCKGTVVLFIPTLFGYFGESILICLFIFSTHTMGQPFFFEAIPIYGVLPYSMIVHCVGYCMDQAKSNYASR